jgi:hypothetical protein
MDGWSGLLWDEAEFLEELAFLRWCERTCMDVTVNTWLFAACESAS